MGSLIFLIKQQNSIINKYLFSMRIFILTSFNHFYYNEKSEKSGIKKKLNKEVKKFFVFLLIKFQNKYSQRH